MNREKLQNFFNNLEARIKLDHLASDNSNHFSATVHRDGENVLFSKRLHFRGYEDDFYRQAREVEGPSTVNILVTREGRVIDTVSVRNRK